MTEGSPEVLATPHRYQPTKAETEDTIEQYKPDGSRGHRRKRPAP